MRLQDIRQVVCTKDVTKYNHKTDGVDWDEQLWEQGAGFSYNQPYKIGTNLCTQICVILVK